MKKLLITGANGFLGWNICRLAKDTWHLFGTVYSHQIEIPNVNTIKIDLTDHSELKGLFEEFLNERGLWIDFISYIEAKGYTPEELDLEVD